MMESFEGGLPAPPERRWPPRPLRMLRYPLLFAAGWLFNFVYDVRFMAGFASGWIARSWIGQMFM